MFYHSLNIICASYVIPMRYVFKLIGFRPKTRQFFKILSILSKKSIFLPVFITIIIISD